MQPAHVVYPVWYASHQLSNSAALSALHQLLLYDAFSRHVVNMQRPASLPRQPAPACACWHLALPPALVRAAAPWPHRAGWASGRPARCRTAPAQTRRAAPSARPPHCTAAPPAPSVRNSIDARHELSKAGYMLPYTDACTPTLGRTADRCRPRAKVYAPRASLLAPQGLRKVMQGASASTATLAETPTAGPESYKGRVKRLAEQLCTSPRRKTFSRGKRVGACDAQARGAAP